MSTIKKVTVTALAAALGVTTLAACGSDGDAKDGGSGSSSKTVTLVTHDSFAVSDSVLADFTKQSGYKVKILKSGDAGTALNKEILTKGSPRATSSSASTTRCSPGPSTRDCSPDTRPRAWTR